MKLPIVIVLPTDISQHIKIVEGIQLFIDAEMVNVTGWSPMIAWPVLSCNAFNTSHLMGIVRVYLRIPSIGEHPYTIVPKIVPKMQH